MNQLDNQENPKNEELNSASNMAKVLPMMAMDEIPHAKADAKCITALVKKSGTVTGYQLSDGSIISKDEGISLAEQGRIQGVGIAHNKDTVYLKSIPDGTEDNNLGHLPTVNHTF